MKINYSKSWLFKLSLISLLEISFSSFIPIYKTAQAQVTSSSEFLYADYTPPPKGRPKSVQGSGSRSGMSCDSSLSNIHLILLVPQDHIGQTTKNQPSFFWYLSRDVLVPIKFTLVKPGVPKPLFIKQLDTAKAGINQITISQDVPPLEEDTEYRWTVSLICNPNRPMDNIYVEDRIIKQSVSSELANQLKSAKTESEISDLYAKNGFWFDALAFLYQAKTNNPKDLSLENKWNSLLNDGGLQNIIPSQK